MKKNKNPDSIKMTKKEYDYEIGSITSIFEDRKAVLLSTSEIKYISRLNIIFYIESLLERSKRLKQKSVSLKYLKKELHEQVHIQKKTLGV